MIGKRETVFVGFGFGAIQAGLFAREAFLSGQFDRLVIAEVVDETVAMVRKAHGRFNVNIAERNGIRAEAVEHVELLNPRHAEERQALVAAVAASPEMATALPSVNFYGDGQRADDVVGILRDGLELKRRTGGPAALIYTAENHNHAAESLRERLAVAGGVDGASSTCILNTVIGKMSGVVDDAGQIREQGLQPIGPHATRAFLVESFNRILVSRIPQNGDFQRRIAVFEEKSDLLPFEEAKLYGHNATHALLGFLLARGGAQYMSDARRDPALIQLARAAFIEESGAALCRKYAGLDPLFTTGGFTAYANDLLERMMNPHLRDRVERIIRDPRRKLGWSDRLIGTMRMALEQNIAPRRYACAAAAAMQALAAAETSTPQALAATLWPEARDSERQTILQCIAQADDFLREN